ncbi:MAG TPA: hypothetical protein VL048_06130 [Xanthobacteraceae bacterium]|nr:hypothetical protein [Xanthobacteraceae bacterium]
MPVDVGAAAVAPLSCGAACCAVVAAFASAAILAFAAAMALTAAACLMPCAIRAAAIALPLALELGVVLLLVLALPLAIGLELAGFWAPEAWLGPESAVFPAEPPAGADGCWVACGAAADWLGVAGCGVACAAGADGLGAVGELSAGGLAEAGGSGDADAAASSKAPKLCEALSWLVEDGCIRDGDISETAAGKSGAILDILDTLRTPGANVGPGLGSGHEFALQHCNRQASVRRSPNSMNSIAYVAWRAITDGSLYRMVGNSCLQRGLSGSPAVAERGRGPYNKVA